MEDTEESTNDIRNQSRDTDDDFLLDIVICNMRQSSQSYSKKINLKWKDILNYINRKLTSSINADNEVEESKCELKRINEGYLAHQVAIFKNTALLNDCKPTTQFLKMNHRKRGYFNLTKLRVQRTKDVSTQIVRKEIINPSEIREEMKNF